MQNTIFDLPQTTVGSIYFLLSGRGRGEGKCQHPGDSNRELDGKM